MMVLAIDPGRQKCGLAFVAQEEVGRFRIHHREVVETERLVARVLQLLGEHRPLCVLLGDGTQSAVLLRALRETLRGRLEVELVPEGFTSQRARERARAESLPRGLGRLVPVGMRTPPRPYDDLVAVILAEDWFLRQAGNTVGNDEP